MLRKPASPVKRNLAQCDIFYLAFRTIPAITLSRHERPTYNHMKRSLAFLGMLAFASALQAQPLMTDTFSYANGPLTNVAAGIWNWHSGNGGALTLNVVDGRAFIHQPDAASGRDDYNRSIGGSFDPATDNLTKLYAGFTVNFSALPFASGTGTAGSYFAHFKSSTTSGDFYGRVGANQEGAAAGTFRLAVANKNWDTATSIEFPQDLNLNQDYQVVLRLDLATDQSTLWVNPANENSPSVTATDTYTYTAGALLDQFGLRQGTSGSSGNVGAPGDIYFDNLAVGTTFTSVLTPVPEPNSIFLLAAGLALFVWRGSRRAA